MKKILALILALILVFALAACGQAAEKPEETKDDTQRLNNMTLDEIIAEAKSIGRLDTIGMPDDWCNYGNLFAALKEDYGLEHTDVDMGSSEEIALIEAEKDAPTKSMGEVGQQYAQICIDKGIVQGYKPTTWDSVPDWAKDEDGYWMIGYTGATAFMTNVDSVGKEISSWKQIKDDLDNGTLDYKITLGDPTTGACSQHFILAAAYALGGDINNIQPALDFFAELAKAGGLDAGEGTYARFEKGEIDVLCDWDYNIIQNLPDNMNVAVHVPSDQGVASGYVTIISRWAPQAAGAALAREWLFSDAGQLNVAACGAKPVRSDVVIPDDICAYKIPDSEYEDLIYTASMMEEWIATAATIPELWEDNVLPYIT